MNRDKQRGGSAGPAKRPAETPAERYARVAEGLDADAIEQANAQDGARPGKAAPAWDRRDPQEWIARRRAEGLERAPESGGARGGQAPRSEWRNAAAPNQVVALGDGMADAGIRDKCSYELDRDAKPADGDIVAGELDGVGAVLRRMQVIGGARVLTADDPDVAPIPLDEGDVFRCHGVVKSRGPRAK